MCKDSGVCGHGSKEYHAIWPLRNGRITGIGCYSPSAGGLLRDKEPFVTLYLHDMFENPQNCAECVQLVLQSPKSKNGSYCK